MSYILDALTRSQQQRRQMDVPGLDTPQVFGPARRSGRVGLWNGALVMLAGAAIAYGIHAHFNTANRPAAYAPSPLAQEPGAARAPVPASSAGGADMRDDRGQDVTSHLSGGKENAAAGADGASLQAYAAPRHRPTPAKDAGARPPRPGAAPAPPPPRASIASSSQPGDVPARERDASAADVSAGGTAAEEQTDSEPSQPRVSPATEDLVRDLSRLVQRVPPEPSPSPPPTLTTATPVSPPPAPPATAPAAAPQPPALSELPWDVRAGLGALEVNAHLYSDVPTERLVVINMRRYREGEQMSSGPRIDAITPRGAILSHASGRFRIDVR